MKIFKNKLKCLRGHYMHLEYGYAEKSDVYTQTILKITYFFIIPIFYKTLLYEIIPTWAVIQNATCGYTDWKSSKPELIDLYQKQKYDEKRIKVS